MIITDDNFASIVAAVEEGRGIYDNIRKTLQYLLASNSGELLLIAVAVMAGWPMPLLPIHLLWINLVTDGLPALCLAVDPIDPGVMRRPPRRAQEKITDAGFLFSMLLTGVLTAGSALAAFLIALQHEPVEVARTHAFTALVFAQLLCSFSYRSESRPVWRMSLWSNLPLAVVVGGSLGLQLWIQHNATLAGFLKTTLVSWGASLGLFTLALGALAVIEVVKWFRRRRCGRAV
jgi:Ca2+-transporting ATPase